MDQNELNKLAVTLAKANNPDMAKMVEKLSGSNSEKKGLINKRRATEFSKKIGLEFLKIPKKKKESAFVSHEESIKSGDVSPLQVIFEKDGGACWVLR